MKKNKKGFSLIEMLVAISIIITATTVVVAILSSSFRGISKSAVSEEVRQNGNRAISRMSRTIQYAESFQGVSTDNFNFSNETDCTETEGNDYQYLRVRSGGNLVTMSCTNLSMGAGTMSPLIDTSKLEVVEDSCSFRCSQENSDDSPIIGIRFELSQRGAAAPEKSASLFFETTVKMRNK